MSVSRSAAATQLVYPFLGTRLDVDEPGLLQHPQVFRHMRLVESKAIADLADGARTRTQQLQHAEPVAIGERRKRLSHL
jgi:hypothetical protein